MSPRAEWLLVHYCPGISGLKLTTPFVYRPFIAKGSVSDFSFFRSFPPAGILPKWKIEYRKICLHATFRLDSPRAISSVCQSLPGKL